MLDGLSKKFISIKNEISQLESKLDEVKAEIYTSLIDRISQKPQGSVTEKTGQFKITVTNTLSVKVDQEKAMNNPLLFKAKYEYSKEKFEQANDREREIINSMIETKQQKPQFKIEPME